MQAVLPALASPPSAPKRKTTLRNALPMPHTPAAFAKWSWFHVKLTVVQLAMMLAKELGGARAEGKVAETIGHWVLQAAGAWVMTNGGRTALLNGTLAITVDTFKTALFLSTSDLSATETTYAGVTAEHANANGYTTGGISVTLTLSGTSTVTIDVTTDPVWTAAGGDITARFAVVYEVAGLVFLYCLLDSTPANVTATSGNTLTVQTHASGLATFA